MSSEPDVFITYATDNKPLAEQLTKALEIEGFHVWADFKDLRPGQVWKDEIVRALEKAQTYLIVVKQGSWSRDWQDVEWRALLAQTWSGAGKRVIPVWIGGTEPKGFLRNWVSVIVDPDAEPTNWTRHVVDELRSPPKELSPAKAAENERLRQQRYDEIGRMAKELWKYEANHQDFPQGLKV